MLQILVGESLDGGKERPCLSIERRPGHLLGSFLECIQTVFDENFLITVPNPPYSPDLAPSDSWCFCHIKTSLAVRVFSDLDEVLEVVIEFLNEIQPSELQFAFHHWTE
jgi:hypothetical protein